MTIKKKVFLTTDTETCGLQPHNLVYDIGYHIHDKKGNIAVSRNWLVDEIITDGVRMMGAFYAKKIFNWYIPALDAGTIKLRTWEGICSTMRNDILVHGVDVIAAYNARFDTSAIRATSNALGLSGAIVPHGVDLLCIWQTACQTILNRSTYHRFAAAHDLVTDAGNVKTSAEAAHRYITNQPYFIETHTALDDATIEVGILANCFKQKKAIPYNHMGGTWRDAQKVKR